MLSFIITTVAVILMAWKSASYQRDHGYASFWRAFFLAFLGFSAVIVTIWGMIMKW